MYVPKHICDNGTFYLGIIMSKPSSNLLYEVSVLYIYVI